MGALVKAAEGLGADVGAIEVGVFHGGADGVTDGLEVRAGMGSAVGAVIAQFICVATTIQIGSDWQCSIHSCTIACISSITRGSNAPNGSSVATCVRTASV